MKRLIVQMDPNAAYAEASALRSALRAGDWASCRHILGGVPQEARTWLMRDVDATKGVREVLRRALVDDLADGTAAAQLGFHLIAAGWRIRTAASASRVSRRRFARFHATLGEAEQVLAAGLRQDSADPALWVAGLTIARGLELGLPEARIRYARLADIDPHHLPGQAQMVQQLCPKWGGTWAEMHAFARRAMLAAPEGSPQGSLIVEGHLERWLVEGRRYLESAAVRDEIVEAAHRSVLHPDFQRTIGWVRVMNTFAMGFALIRDRESAATMFTALGPYGSPLPWSYHGNEAAAFRWARAWAFGWSGPAMADRLLAAVSTGRASLLGILGMGWR